MKTPVNVKRLKTARFRARFMAKIRSFFLSRNVLEVETPILSHGCPTDCYIDPFSLHFSSSLGKSEILYLQTSPEFPMKRLLTQGFPDIFQLCKVFRKDELGMHHNPEFTMLEWYRLDFSMIQLIEEVANLVQFLLETELPTQKMSYQNTFIQYLSIDPFQLSVKDLVQFCHDRSINIPVTISKTDLLMFLFSECIEPKLPQDTLVFIHNYPLDQAVFAITNRQDQKSAKRFELFYNGLELCNGFEELTDWRENEMRMEKENIKRRSIGKSILPGDKKFIHSLKQGLPPCSGVAIGIDRLVMIAGGYETIQKAILFPLNDS